MNVQFPDADRKKLDETLLHAYVAQQAIHPLDQARAEGTVDGTLWTGVSKPTPLQKAGFLVFGGFFILAGIANIAIMYERTHTFGLESIVGIAFTALGIRIALNAFRSRKRKA